MNRSSPPLPCASQNCNFNDASIDCAGSCQQRFHAVCVGLDANAVTLITTSPNWFWFCDVCRHHTWKEWIAGIPVKRSTVEGSSSCGSSNCIFTDQLIKCDGSCGKDFHGMCVKLSKNDLTVISSSANILWVCDGCNGKVPEALDGHDEETTECEGEHQVGDDSMVVKLETKFESIIAKLNKLNENLENGAYTPPDSTPNSDENSDGEGFREKDDQAAESTTLDNDVTVTVAEVAEAAEEDIVEVPAVDLTKNDCESLEPSAIEDNSPSVESPKKKPVNIFSFGSAKQCESPVENYNFSFAIPTDCVELFKRSLAEQKPKSPKPAPVVPVELEKDINNNLPEPAKPPQEVAPAKKIVLAPMVNKVQLTPMIKKEFALWIKFDDPDLSSRDVCWIVRKALGMSIRDSVEARNVVPGHIRFTGQALYASFKVNLDARWKTKALDGATWSSVEDYLEHSEWIDRW